jgi:hypothetical protein
MLKEFADIFRGQVVRDTDEETERWDEVRKLAYNGFRDLIPPRHRHSCRISRKQKASHHISGKEKDPSEFVSECELYVRDVAVCLSCLALR